MPEHHEAVPSLTWPKSLLSSKIDLSIKARNLLMTLGERAAGFRLLVTTATGNLVRGLEAPCHSPRKQLPAVQALLRSPARQRVTTLADGHRNATLSGQAMTCSPTSSDIWAGSRSTSRRLALRSARGRIAAVARCRPASTRMLGRSRSVPSGRRSKRGDARRQAYLLPRLWAARPSPSSGAYPPSSPRLDADAGTRRQTRQKRMGSLLW
jgi:hypothetical protein